MPLPLIIGIGAAVAAAGGLGTGIHGAVKLKGANDTMKSADLRHKRNIARFEAKNATASGEMDTVGNLELSILGSFEKFSEVFEKIQGKPEFEAYSKDEVKIPAYNAEELKKVSVGAGILLGGIGSAAVGTAGGFAAAGATTAAVMALGTASTGTAIASLSGIAATNATLAALGGGALAVGGGGIALGTTILSAATFGVGLLIGGVIFNITGSALSDKADKAESQMRQAEQDIDKICVYLDELGAMAVNYVAALTSVQAIYETHLNMLSYTVNMLKKTEWSDFSEEQKLITENTVLLVSLLHNMCKVQLVLASGNSIEPNRVNTEGVNKSMLDAETFLKESGLV